MSQVCQFTVGSIDRGRAKYSSPSGKEGTEMQDKHIQDEIHTILKDIDSKANQDAAQTNPGTTIHVFLVDAEPEEIGRASCRERV